MSNKIPITWLLLCLSIIVTPLLPPAASGFGVLYLSVFYFSGLIFLVTLWSRLERNRFSLLLIIVAGFMLSGFFYFIHLRNSSIQGPFLLTILLASNLARGRFHIKKRLITEREIFVIGILIFLIFIYSMREIDGRQASFSGDPNHTAALFILPTLLLTTYSKNLKHILFFYAISFAYAIFTASRGGVIAIVAYILYKNIIGRFRKRYRIYVLIAISMLVISMQYIFLAVFMDALSGSESGRDTVGVFDQSNFGRISSFGYAIPYLYKSMEAFLIGSQEYWRNSSDFSVVLHHGFLDLALQNGVPLVLFVTYLTGVLAVKTRVDYEAYFISLVIVGASLSAVIFAFPILIMIMACISQNAAIEADKFSKNE